jgi:hypothetical protein
VTSVTVTLVTLAHCVYLPDKPLLKPSQIYKTMSSNTKASSNTLVLPLDVLQKLSAELKIMDLANFPTAQKILFELLESEYFISEGKCMLTR